MTLMHRSARGARIDAYGGAPCAYVPPSFFLPEEDLSRSEHQIVVAAIKHQFIGDGRLTQKKMEGFFHTDAYFVDATPGFFAAEHA